MSSTRSFSMSNSQRNPVRTGTVFYRLLDGIEEVRSGCLLKSPPAKKFKTLRSWKRRFFVLFRINEKEHALRYFKSSEERDKPLGGIQISQISALYSSPQSHSKWSWIFKTFNCHPASVLFIQVARREYFLIDENKDNVEGWFQDISRILLSRGSEFSPENMLTQTTSMMTNSSSQQGSEFCPWVKDASGRSFSDPVHPLNVSHEAPENSIKDKGPDKSRPMSDPVLKLDQIKLQKNCSQQDEGNENSMSNPVYEEFQFDFSRRFSVDSSSSDRSTGDPSSMISPEPIYDTPRNLMKYWSQDSTDIEDENHDGNVVESFYMRMDTVHENVTMGQEGNKEIPATSSHIIEEEAQLQSPRPSQGPPPEKSRVSPAHILLNWTNNKSHTSSRLEPQNHSYNCDRGTGDVREITVNQNDLKSHLTLVEVNGKPCISNWPALPETKCLFRKGDEILAVNDLHTESVEEVQTYLNKLLKDQVKLTVLRQPGSEASLPSRWGSNSAIE